VYLHDFILGLTQKLSRRDPATLEIHCAADGCVHRQTEPYRPDALSKAATAAGLVFIEIHTGRLDCPESLRSAGRSMAKTNQLD